MQEVKNLVAECERKLTILRFSDEIVSDHVFLFTTQFFTALNASRFRSVFEAFTVRAFPQRAGPRDERSAPHIERIQSANVGFNSTVHQTRLSADAAGFQCRESQCSGKAKAARSVGYSILFHLTGPFVFASPNTRLRVSNIPSCLAHCSTQTQCFFPFAA